MNEKKLSERSEIAGIRYKLNHYEIRNRDIEILKYHLSTPEKQYMEKEYSHNLNKINDLKKELEKHEKFIRAIH